jgi:D-alanyl-D-alanine carboxypeptidase/D-alanyl-D-alanine-endopeptidase (penicillin-binding protein 4)
VTKSTAVVLARRLHLAACPDLACDPGSLARVHRQTGQGPWRPRMLAAAAAASLLVGPLPPVAADPIDRSAPQVLAPILIGTSLGDALDPTAVADAIRPLLTGGALGAGRTPAHVVDVATGEVLLSQADRPTVPASTMKLVTAISVLDALGADAVLETRTAILDPDAAVARVVLVGSGDPSLRSTGTKVGGAGTSLSPASLAELADRTARALRSRGVEEVRVGYDDSLFTGPSLHPTWARSFPAAGIVAPVSALQVDQGRRSPTRLARAADPAARAAEVFADQLRDAGVRVRGRLRQVRLESGSVRLASVDSPTVGVLVERMLATSDNDYAEALGRLGAAASGEQASFAGVAARGESVLAELGVAHTGDRVADASGLSRANALVPSTVTGLLAATADRFSAVSSGLAVSGSTGSLRARYDTRATQAARGVVRAKTGTLTGVVGLAGYVSRPDGRLLSFAILDDSVPGGALGGRAAIDRALAALVECRCAEVGPSPAP